MRSLFVAVLSLLLAVSPVMAKQDLMRDARVEQVGEWPVLHVYGTPYEMGYQQGQLLRSKVRASVENIERFMFSYLPIPIIGSFLVRWKLNHSWAALEPYVSEAYLQELHGLADGAGISFDRLKRVHALPDLTSTSCASFAARPPLTKEGQFIHIRNLDWAIRSNAHEYAALIVYHPDEGHQFVNIGWLGFMGVISGINEHGLSVAEVGAETIDESLDGTPMPFLLRDVLQHADGLEDAANRIQQAKRTVGYNYVFADAKTQQAVAIETTHSHAAVYWMDQPTDNPYQMPLEHALMRSDFSLNEDVRNVQLACRGNPDQEGLESPLESHAYRVRYYGQGLLLEQWAGSVDAEKAKLIAAAVAPPSNVQSLVYAYPTLWMAIAQDQTRASERTYYQVDLKALFE